MSFPPDFPQPVNEPNKIYILGDKAVGKTSLVRAINKIQFKEKLEPALKVITISKLKLENKLFTIKDLTDDSAYKCIKYYEDEIEQILCVIFVFSLTEKESYNHAKFLVKTTLENIRSNDSLQIILCGNKYDMVLNDENNRAVSQQEIEEYVQNILVVRDCKYIEISCKTGYNIDEILKVINELEIESKEGDSEEEQDKKTSKNGHSCIIF